MDYLNENLMSLNKHIDEATLRDIKAADTSGIVVEKAKRSDCVTVKVDTNNGWIYLHSKYNPEEEAMKLIEAYDYASASVIFCLGFGLGYHLEYLQRVIAKDTKVVVIETHLPLANVSLNQKDYRGLFEDTRFHFIFGDRSSIGSQLSKLVDQNMGLMLHIAKVISLYPMDKISPGYADFIKETYNTVGRNMWSNIGNSPEDSIQGIRQTFKNIEHIIQSPPLHELWGKYKDIPSIFVAAGPSLEKNIHHLKKVKDNAVIIASDTALSRLLREGIHPHFVCSLERGEIVYDTFYKNKTMDPSAVLVGLNVLWPQIFEDYPGIKAVVGRSTTPFEMILNSILPNFSLLKGGSSVAHLGFSLARALGCNPIVLIGQDLAYGSDGRPHAKGMYDWEDTTEFTNDVPANDGIYVEGIDGNPVRTNPIWKQFKEWYEVEIQDTTAKVIDATEGGAKIYGTDIRDLEAVLNEYLTDRKITQPKDELMHVLSSAKDVSDREKVLKAYVESQLSKFDQVKMLIEQMRDCTNGIVEHIKNENAIELKNELIQFENRFDVMTRISSLFTFCTQYYVFQHYEYSNKQQFSSFLEAAELVDYMGKLVDNLMKVLEDLYLEFNTYLNQNH